MTDEWVHEEIAVESYAGYKGEESPRAFARYEVSEVLDRWYEGGLDPQDLRRDHFRVRTASGRSS